ncbi:MAG: hypothetical protein ACRDJW_13790 [Thermomicrobiales bacterium]
MAQGDAGTAGQWQVEADLSPLPLTAKLTANPADVDCHLATPADTTVRNTPIRRDFWTIADVGGRTERGRQNRLGVGDPGAGGFASHAPSPQ